MSPKLRSPKLRSPKLRERANEQAQLFQQESTLASSAGRGEKKALQLKTRLELQTQLLNDQEVLRQALQSRRTILKRDVELNSIYGVLMVTLMRAIQYALEEYVSNARMYPIAFLERVVTLLARLRVLTDIEILTFAYDRRDPDVMGLLKQPCGSVEARSLRALRGRIMRVQLDPVSASRCPRLELAHTGGRFRPRLPQVLSVSRSW